MIRYFISFALLLFCSSAWAQTGSLQGQLTDEESEESLPFAPMALMQGDNQIAVVETDLNGNYNFSNIKVGSYSLVITYPSYPSKTITGISISSGQVRFMDVQLSQVVKIETTTITAKDPIVDPGKNEGGSTRDAEFIVNNPERGIGGAITSTATVNAADEGEAISSGGSRTTSNLIMVNGIPVLGGVIPIADVEIAEIQIMTSGISAQYGNATGSITNIITKDPATQFRGSIQAETSQFLDNFGASTLNAFFSGPMIAKPMINALGDTLKRNGKIVKSTILGYRFSGSYFTTKDNRPSALNTFKLSDEKLKELLENPLIANPSGTGTVYASDFLTADDLEKTNVRSNARNSYAQYSASIEFKPSSDYFFSVDASGRFDWGNIADVNNQLFNYNFNPNQKFNTIGFSARFNHTVSSTIPGNKEEEDGDLNRLQPVFQNLSYELIGSYNQTNFSREDPRYKDRLWEYGYVGKFYESRLPVIGIIDSIPIYDSAGEIIGWKEQTGHAAFFNSFDKYEANMDINPGLAAYNNLIDQPNSNPNAPTSINEMEVINGTIAGGRSSVYDLFNAPHLTNSGFSKSNSSQARANVQVKFDLVANQKSGNPMRHQINLGGTFEQQVTRSYNINPFSLWELAYQSANTHISNATDQSRPTGENYYDTETQRNYQLYDALIRKDEEGNEVAMTQFGANLRKSLGLNKRDWIAVHELTPDQMQLDWFEPTTLITGSQRIINYYGYDYKGNPLGTNVSFNDFFTATDENGIKTRPVAPNNPIYLSGYIEDKFIYKDIICRLGVRFDSYDANTSVLKDPYSITGYETAAEFESENSIYAVGQSPEYSRPTNIGDDFAVYVNDNNKDATVIGYRDGKQWYNAQGLPVNTASELGTTFVPALKGFGTAHIDPQGQNYDPNQSFRDYTPEIIVMPRIALSFPISKESNFYANYDILSQRPPQGSFASAYDYYNFREITKSNGIINNPNLKPERTINYEVGFQQALNDFSKLKLSLIYKEERDLIQIQQYTYAYPNTYLTFGNDDFSTTKSFKLEYETLRHKNLKIIANYVLQFSEGTGSNPFSAVGGTAQELKYVFALDFDQRHTLYANIDYRLKGGDDYFGPKIGNFEVFANTGLSLSVNANSGRPYTRKQIAGGLGHSSTDRNTDGSVNGARKPWNFRVGLKIDRNFVIGKNSKNPMRLNIYLRVTNLFNTQNVLDVYSVTGSPTDDGFLTASNGPGPGFAASQPQSYEMLYNLRMNDPYNISRPRRIFLGASFSF
ncbi:TonB-dependent receptor [Aureispira anguillae]|uniref:TonB-dependent receptor n=1 Tax=Aureispira anguillae TaxID=2864201 RepID=A0A915YAQ3_9BACT|nr:TonB-dependent receptor [Aureispira anguillae]BDS09376.1 TonB-dependent receptor [Aureispira anguillae]